MKKSHPFPIVLASVSLMISSLASVSAEEKIDALIKTEVLEINESDDELIKLLKEKRNTALAELTAMNHEYQVGARAVDSLSEASRRFLNSEMELTEKRADRIALYEKYIDFRKVLEKSAELR